MMKKRVNNRGQVTIFIIVAVVILILVGLFFIFRGTLNSKEDPVETSPVYLHAVSCLESTTEQGIEYIGLRGGYYKVPEGVHFSYLADESAYYYIVSAKRIPAIERIQNELGNYIKDNLKPCIDFNSLEEEGYNVTAGELTVSVIIKEGEVDVEADYPITLKKADYTYMFRKLEVEVDSNLERVYHASGEILDSYSEKPGFICMTCLEDVSGDYEVDVKSTPLTEKGVIWFSVLDKESDLNWRFVVEQ